jgi:hypothetical protein
LHDELFTANNDMYWVGPEKIDGIQNEYFFWKENNAATPTKKKAQLV